MLLSNLFLASVAAAAPATLTKRWPAGDTFITPVRTSTYYGSNGAIFANPYYSSISRSTWSGSDVTSLVTFDVSAAKLPKTCSLRLWLDPADWASYVAGTGQVDVFSSLAPAPADGASGWGPGNQRNHHLGRMQVNYNGDATVLDFAPNQLNGFPCPKAGDENAKGGLVGYEIVPVGDQDWIGWDPRVSGLYIAYGDE